MRKEIRKLDQYSAEANMMCKYKLRTLDDVRKYKEFKQEELRNLYNERNRLYYKRKGLDGEIERDSVTANAALWNGDQRESFGMKP